MSSEEASKEVRDSRQAKARKRASQVKRVMQTRAEGRRESMAQGGPGRAGTSRIEPQAHHCFWEWGRGREQGR